MFSLADFQISEAILSMSNEILKILMDDILKHVTCLYILAEAVSLLDMLQVKQRLLVVW